jgi:hypothetical protein
MSKGLPGVILLDTDVVSFLFMGDTRAASISTLGPLHLALHVRVSIESFLQSQDSMKTTMPAMSQNTE